MSDPTKWDWGDALTGVLMGIISATAGLFGWFNGKVGKVEDRIDQRIDTLDEKMVDQARSTAILETHHESHIHRLNRIEDGLGAINEKQDWQMEILMDLRGRER